MTNQTSVSKTPSSSSDTSFKGSKLIVSFCGSDVTPVLNGRAIGEIGKVSFVETFKRELDENNRPLPKVKGTIEVDFFGDDPVGKHMNTRDDEFLLLLATEFGQKSMIRFVDFQFTKREMKVSCDDLMMRQYYYFTASYPLFGEKWSTNTINGITHYRRVIEDETPPPVEAEAKYKEDVTDGSSNN